MGNNQSCGFGVVNNTQHHLTIGLSMAGTHYYENMVAPGEVFYRWPGAVWYTVFVYPTKIMGEMTDAKAAGEILKTTALGVGAAVLAGGGLMLVGGAVAGAGGAAAAGAAETGVAVAAGGSMAALGVGIEATQLLAGGIAVTAGVFNQIGWQVDDQTVHYLGEFYSVLPSNRNNPGFESLKADLFKSFKGRQIYTDMKGCYGGGSGTWLEVTGLPRLEISGKTPRFVGLDIKLVERDFEYFKMQLNYPSLKYGKWKFTDYSKKQYESGLTK